MDCTSISGFVKRGEKNKEREGTKSEGRREWDIYICSCQSEFYDYLVSIQFPSYEPKASESDREITGRKIEEK